MMNMLSSLKGLFKKAIFLFVVFFLSLYGYGQASIPLNLYKSTQLVFSHPIRNVIIGTGDLQIQKTVLNNVLSLTSKTDEKEFVPTNLYISTEDDFHYSFDITYKDNIEDWTFYIDENIATVKGVKKRIKEERTVGGSEIILEDSDAKILKSVLEDHRKERKYYKKFDGIYLRYVNHYYYNQFHYYKLEISNTSNQDYIIDYLKIFIDTKGKKGVKKKSNTRKLLLLDTDYTIIYGRDAINPKETITIVYKLNKTTLNKEQKLTFELKEKKGNRDLELSLRRSLINDAYALKH